MRCSRKEHGGHQSPFVFVGGLLLGGFGNRDAFRIEARTSFCITATGADGGTRILTFADVSRFPRNERDRATVSTHCGLSRSVRTSLMTSRSFSVAHRTPIAPRKARAFTRGFGPLIEEEHSLQSSIDEILEASDEHGYTDTRRTLEGQQLRIAAGIIQLERHCETLPHPNRFQVITLRDQFPPDGKSPALAPSSPGGLAGLVMQHICLAGAIEALIEHGRAGAAAELTLKSMARSHVDMAWMLTALLTEGAMPNARIAPYEGAGDNQGICAYGERL